MLTIAPHSIASMETDTFPFSDQGYVRRYPVAMMEWAFGAGWRGMQIATSCDIARVRTGLDIKTGDTVISSLERIYAAWTTLPRDAGYEPPNERLLDVYDAE